LKLNRKEVVIQMRKKLDLEEEMKKGLVKRKWTEGFHIIIKEET
jgi:hypothetical protein